METEQRLAVDSAFRYGTGSFEEDHFNVWSPSTVIKVPVGERWKIHAEYFSVATDGRELEGTQHFFSPGVHYLITKNFELGIRVGWGSMTGLPISSIILVVESAFKLDYLLVHYLQFTCG
jgi:hypothetical protein